jgi:hypothetical protein
MLYMYLRGSRKPENPLEHGLVARLVAVLVVEAWAFLCDWIFGLECHRGLPLLLQQGDGHAPVERRLSIGIGRELRLYKLFAPVLNHNFDHESFDGPVTGTVMVYLDAGLDWVTIRGGYLFENFIHHYIFERHREQYLDQDPAVSKVAPFLVSIALVFIAFHARVNFPSVQERVEILEGSSWVGRKIGQANDALFSFLPTFLQACLKEIGVLGDQIGVDEESSGGSLRANQDSDDVSTKPVKFPYL